MNRHLVRMLVILMVSALSLTGNAVYADGIYDGTNPPIVEVEGGKLRGYMDGDTYTFAGIRYAIAERFGPPQPVEPWEGVQDAQAYGPVCITNAMTSVANDEFVWPHRYWVESEDCQYLNIWSQELNPAAKKPVMVFLHGGAYTNGSSIEAYAYDGKNLSEFGDVVVVTLNHRINVIGTFNLSAYDDQYANSGNTGMADLVAALEWIQDNIRAFGGDPDCVTIFGQSGGSGKVVNLMQMPAAEGLFHRAIAQSSGLPNVLSLEESLRITELTLENLGIADNWEMVLEVPYYDLLDAANRACKQAGEELGRSVSYRPLQDDVYIMSDFCDFAADIPFMVGTNFSERSSNAFYAGTNKNTWTATETYDNLTALYGADNVDEIISEFTRLFPNKKVQDAHFYAPSYRVTVGNALSNKINSVTAPTRAPVYNYLFSFEAPANGGVLPFHCAELIYAFHNVSIPQLQIATGGTQACYDVQDITARAWVNFAYTGNPSQKGLEWRPFNETGETMIIDVISECKVLDDQHMVSLMQGQ